ncbi:MAG: enoyl-CoA hydratase/isomerase family protein [Actinomycetota bacterium]|nr:enoyl-CoA hydratase/isomerase family protein [Actinomycetota bacterium]
MGDTYEAITTAVDGAVATITLSRPKALNAITPAMLDEVTTALTGFRDDPAIGVIVLTGEGRAFSAGVDLKAIAGGGLSDGNVGGTLDDRARRVIELIEAMAEVVIAKVNGFCFTGALELVLACDLVVTATEAKLGDTHAKWGLRPTWGMSQRLPRAIGLARARMLSYTAATFSGTEAVEWGLAVAAHPVDELDAAVAELAATITANSRGSIAAYKDLYRVARETSLADGLAYEASTSYEIADTADRVSGFG